MGQVAGSEAEKKRFGKQEKTNPKSKS